LFGLSAGRFQQLSQYLQIAGAIPQQLAARRMREVLVRQLDQLDAVRWKHIAPTLVIELTLTPAIDTAHGHAVRLVEEHDRFAVLALAVLNDERQLRVVGVHGQLLTGATVARVTTQECEAMLAQTGQPKDVIAEREHVRFIALGAASHATRIPFLPVNRTLGA
jgi:hypothetical protein